MSEKTLKKDLVLEENLIPKNQKDELISKIIELREQEKYKCLSEINAICERYQFRLEAEVIINSNGNHTNVFLHDISK